ncbi:Ribonuclease H-like domain containing protein [Trema orientale]|uniref:Ribonuclease H-like domain containing protein n=1 Tax=Trema orientale TaxID=63057 RepID=A0A2P5EI88_TREOI|nr:Ribonuclease H-like domain containing protein [Trema orientale]
MAFFIGALSSSSRVSCDAMALRKSIQFTRDAGLTLIIIESDSLNVVNLINRFLKSKSDIGVIINDIQYLLTTIPQFFAHHVSRTCNTIAHDMAIWALKHDGDFVWLEDAPSCLLASIENYVILSLNE